MSICCRVVGESDASSLIIKHSEPKIWKGVTTFEVIHIVLSSALAKIDWKITG